MNPVQFKITSTEEKPMTKVKGMTVFNTNDVNTKKQPMFFGQPLGVQRYDNFKYPQFENLTTTLENEKFQIHSSQGTAEATTSATYTSSWNGTLIHLLNVTFSSADHRRQFFNAGGEIRFASNITYLGSSAKTIDWMGMLVNMGTVKMGYTSTSSTGSGSGSTVGFHDLTTAFQTLFTKNGTGLYAANNYELKAKLVGTTQVQFRAEWNDANTGNPNYDENVLGTLNSTITQLRATGTYVEVPTPTHSTDAGSNLT